VLSTTAAPTGTRLSHDRRAGGSTAHLVDATMFWSPAGGGVGRYLRSKQDWVARQAPHWRHTLLVPGGEGQGQCYLGAPPLPFSGGYRFPLNRRAATRTLVRLKPDVVEVGDPYRLAWSALDAGWRLGIPVVAFCHSHLGELARRLGGRTAERLARGYLGRLYRQFDTVFAASQWMVGELRAMGLDNVVHQPLGVDCLTFHPRHARLDWRIRLGLSRDDFVLLYAGRFAPEKNLQVLVEAVRRLGNRAFLVMIGDGPVVPKGPRVIRLPYEGDTASLATALASADLFVHAGDQETFGLAVLESLASGTPVVACARGGLLDFVDQHTVLGVPKAGAVEFAEAIASIRVCAGERRDSARVRALQYDHRMTFLRQFERYESMRAASGFGEPGDAAAQGAGHAA
jgi:alpha-1,6-mannosyltransferase